MTTRRDYCPQARSEGREAYIAGAKLGDNPNERGTPEFREWARGWRYSQHLAGQTPKPRKEHVGREAFRLGKVLADNPYDAMDPKQRVRYYGWDAGWRAAQSTQWRWEGYNAQVAGVEAIANPYEEVGWIAKSDWLCGWWDAALGKDAPREREVGHPDGTPMLVMRPV